MLLKIFVHFFIDSVPDLTQTTSPKEIRNLTQILA